MSLPRTPMACNFKISPLCQTRSKAPAMSKATTYVPAVIQRVIPGAQKEEQGSDVDRPFRNPRWCADDESSLPCWLMALSKTLFKTLQERECLVIFSQIWSFPCVQEQFLRVPIVMATLWLIHTLKKRWQVKEQGPLYSSCENRDLVFSIPTPLQYQLYFFLEQYHCPAESSLWPESSVGKACYEHWQSLCS